MSVKMETRRRDVNTIIEPWVDVRADLAVINAGRASRRENRFFVNGRTYGWHDNGRLFPVEGDGFHQIDRPTYKALGFYNSLGATAETEEILDQEQIRVEFRPPAKALHALFLRWRDAR